MRRLLMALAALLAVCSCAWPLAIDGQDIGLSKMIPRAGETVRWLVPLVNDSGEPFSGEVTMTMRVARRGEAFGESRRFARFEYAGALQPRFELGRGPQPEYATRVQRVVERGALVVQHHVVGAGHAHDEIAAGYAEQRQQHVHVVLVGIGMVRVADVAAHRQAEQLAAEVILETGADDLLAVVQVLGADEAHDGVDQQRGEPPCDRVGPRLERLLVAAAMRVRRQRAALPGLEVHDMAADAAVVEARAAAQRQGRLLRLGKQR